MEIKVRKNSTKVVQIGGDVRWDLYGGTFLRIQNKNGEMCREVVHIPKRAEGETKFTLYAYTLQYSDFKEAHSWVDWDAVYSFADLHSVEDLQDYDLLIAAASCYGWYDFDSYPIQLTKTQLSKHWKIQ